MKLLVLSQRYLREEENNNYINRQAQNCNSFFSQRICIVGAIHAQR